MKAVKNAMTAVQAVRERNADVFVWPSVEWDLLYCHEELSELARVVQTLNAPDHARNTTDAGLSVNDRLHLEFGQVLMMVLTTGLELGLDGDLALEIALRKIDFTAERKRRTHAQA